MKTYNKEVRETCEMLHRQLSTPIRELGELPSINSITVHLFNILSDFYSKQGIQLNRPIFIVEDFKFFPIISNTKTRKNQSIYSSFYVYFLNVIAPALKEDRPLEDIIEDILEDFLEVLTIY